MASGLVFLLFKGKGARDNLDGYRGICLLSIVSRVVARILALRLAKWAEANNVLTETQYGFRKERSTRDVILLARMVAELLASLQRRVAFLKNKVEKLTTAARESEDAAKALKVAKSAEAKLQMVMVLIDIKKAYPSVPRALCWAVLLRRGVPAHVVSLLATLHGGTVYEVRTVAGDSDPYLLKKGLREGCP